MATETRKAVRKKLADLIEASLVTSLGIVQAVYDYKIGDFQGASPVVVVTSGGSNYKPFTFQGTMPVYRIRIYVFVVYNTEDGTWTEANAEDAIDDINKAIADVISANDSLDNYWVSLEQAEMSDVGSVVIGGVEYQQEIIEVVVNE